MNVTITGATGLIGRRVAKIALASNHRVYALGRRSVAGLPPGAQTAVWDALAGPPPGEALDGADAVVHLAGEPVAQRWTAEAKQRILDSRVLGTRRLVEALAAREPRPAVLVSASAVGYYGSRGDEILTEPTAPGSGFLAEVCQAWEAEADRAAEWGIRVVKLRIGVVLAEGGGALARMVPVFRAFLGGRVGSGRQWMPWIHLEDLAALVLHLVTHPVSGAVNAVSPNPATNAAFTRALAAALGRPALLPAPGFLLRAVFGEMAEVLLSSQRVLPEAARRSGFIHHYPELDGALKNILRR